MVMSWDSAGPATWSVGMQDGGAALGAQQGCCPDGQLVLSHLTQPLCSCDEQHQDLAWKNPKSWGTTVLHEH